jgi:hypothetical protein
VINAYNMSTIMYQPKPPYPPLKVRLPCFLLVKGENDPGPQMPRSDAPIAAVKGASGFPRYPPPVTAHNMDLNDVGHRLHFPLGLRCPTVTTGLKCASLGFYFELPIKI